MHVTSYFLSLKYLAMHVITNFYRYMQLLWACVEPITPLSTHRLHASTNCETLKEILNT